MNDSIMFSLSGPNNNEFALNLAVTDLRTTNSNSQQARRKCHKAFVVHHGLGFCTIGHTSEQNCDFQNNRKTCLPMKVCVLNT